MARGTFAYRDGDLIGEGFTGGPPIQAAPFAVDIIHDSAWLNSLPKTLRPNGMWGVYGGFLLGDNETQRLNYLRVTFQFFPGAAQRLDAAFKSAFRRN